MSKYEFAIKQNTLKSGKVVNIPLCRRKANRLQIFNNPWERIVRIYDEYLLQDLDFNPDLTLSECEDHIRAYKEKLNNLSEDDIIEEKIHEIEE
jgi:hypothetical protein